MSPKDQQIIKANPTATPYELHATLGLSKGGFNELIAVEDEKADNVLKAKTPILRPDLRAAIPVTTMHQPIGHGSQVTLRGKKGNGNGTLMSRIVAEKMVKKYPKDFEII